MESYMIGEYRIEEVQEIMLEILVEVDHICRENDIKYILDGGSMLGAVRHHGFIPWDDDLDIAMLRSDYNKLMELCKTSLNDKFVWESIETSTNHPLNFAKIKKKNTVYKERLYKDLDICHGVYIDVFPIDDVNDKRLKTQLREVAFWNSVRWCSLGIYPKNFKRFLYAPFTLLGRTIINRMSVKSMTRYNNGYSKEVYKICHSGTMKPKYPRSIYTELIDWDFCGKKFYIPKEYDAFLRGRFGHYMELPPQEKRRPCHNIVECKI